MKRHSKLNLGSLPQHLRDDPAMTAWRMDHIEQTQADHAERLQDLEQSPLQNLEAITDKIPWGKLAPLILLALAALFGLISPEQARQKAQAIVGIVW